MQILLMAKKEERSGLERKKDDRGGLIVRNGNFDWSLTCQSVNNKNSSVPKECNFHGGFLQHMANRQGR